MKTIEERFTDAERTRLLGIALQAPRHRGGDPELARIIDKLTGPDVVLVARRPDRDRLRIAA